MCQFRFISWRPVACCHFDLSFRFTRSCGETLKLQYLGMMDQKIPITLTWGNPYLGKWSELTANFHMGWKDQLVNICAWIELVTTNLFEDLENCPFQTTNQKTVFIQSMKWPGPALHCQKKIVWSIPFPSLGKNICVNFCWQFSFYVFFKRCRDLREFAAREIPPTTIRSSTEGSSKTLRFAGSWVQRGGRSRDFKVPPPWMIQKDPKGISFF